MLLYGKNPVLERIKVSPGSIHKLYLQKATDLSTIVKEAKKAGLSFESVEKSAFAKVCKDANTQGVCAEVDDFEYTEFRDMLSWCLNMETVLLFLDGITDPQNLGAIIRTTACLGGFSIVLPEFEACHVTEAVLRVASGGENYVKISKVTNLATTLKNIKEEGVVAVGAAAEAGLSVNRAKFSGPLAVVIGSEGKGIRPGIEKHLDRIVSLPMEGAKLSYNASIAAALFCYEIMKGRDE